MKKILLILLLTSFTIQERETFNFKIGIDYSRLAKIKTEVPEGEIKYKNLREKIFPSVVKHLEESYSVYGGNTLSLSSTSDKCGDYTIDENLRKSLNVSLVILVDWKYDKDDAFTAYAGACKVSTYDGRPIMGTIIINLYYLDAKNDVNFENSFTTLLHEAHHILGFQSNFFKRFYNEDINGTRPETEVVTETSATPFQVKFIMSDVLEFAKEHFDCSSMDGVPLENSGTEATKASHWDKFVLGNELMGPSAYVNLVPSKFTMLFLKSSGFFKVNLNMAETLVWGLKAGCDIFKGDCTKNPEICTPDLATCSFDYKSIGKCSEDKYAEGCNIFKEDSAGDCRHVENQDKIGDIKGLMKFGPGSRCFMGKIGNGNGEVQTKESPSCLKSECYTENEVDKIKIVVESKDVICADSGKSVEYETGKYVICPNIERFCKKGMLCKNDCNGNGRCKEDGSCWCYSGFSGEFCDSEIEPYFVTVLHDESGVLAKVIFVIIGSLFLGIV